MGVEIDSNRKPTRTLNHLLKIFRIDPQPWVRAIYSVATLDVAALVNDMKTVAGDVSRTAKAGIRRPGVSPPGPLLRWRLDAALATQGNSLR